MPQPPIWFKPLASVSSYLYCVIRYGKRSMEALFAQALKDSATLRKTSVPWVEDEPSPQGYFAYDDAKSSWVERKPDEGGKHGIGIGGIVLFSWNVDFMLPFGEARMKKALQHLANLVQGVPETSASVIFIQECTASDVATFSETPWIRERFYVSDLDTRNWATGHYGTVTLLDNRLPVKSAFRVHYSQTRMDRDAFFIDVSLNNKTVRLCNSHLESLALDPPYRPPQMQLIAKFLHEPSIHAGLAAGDFNAIQPFDRTLHSDNDLKDAFLELGGKEDSDEGYTWGQQAATKLKEQFGCSRMDKVFYCGDMKVTKFERFGRDVVLEDGEEASQIIGLGFEKAWVTDHLGIKAEVNLGEGGSSHL